jgi:glycosyltransferase involved in cell wall biosynthesis
VISLIVATYNRGAELERLLASLDAQTYRHFEVIVVDQNQDERLMPVLERYSRLDIRHIPSDIGVSRARNAGLRVCSGELVAFPDDDCWYHSSDLLAQVVPWFEQHPDYDGLLTGMRDVEGKSMGPKWQPGRGARGKLTVLWCALGWNFFFRRHAAERIGFFREDIGPGTPSPYQSGEDLDYVVRAVEQGSRMWLEPSLSIHHPHKEDRPPEKEFAYHRGVGYVWRIHGYPLWWCLFEVGFRSLGGSAFYLCKGNRKKARSYLLRAKAQWLGYYGDRKRSGSPVLESHIR